MIKKFLHKRPRIFFQDNSYGIEGTYLVQLKAFDESYPFIRNDEITKAGEIVRRVWKTIPEHFNYLDLSCYSVGETSFSGLIRIDLSGKTTGQKEFVYNIVSQYEIAFGMMVGHKNPFLIEGSIFHVLSWMKASSLIELRKEPEYASFKWSSGFFDFEIIDPASEQRAQQILQSNGSILF